MTAAPPRLALVGPMLGRNPGWVVTQGEILGDLLARDGYDVRLTSEHVGRVRRVTDILTSLVAWRNQVDVVVHMVFSGSAFRITDAASALCQRLGLPQIFVLRGGALPEFTDRNPDFVRRVLERADALVSPSGFLAHYYEEESGFNLPVRVIPNILDIDNYPFRERITVVPRLLWMRTFHDVYHPELAVETLQELQRTHPEATLTMAGQDKGLLAPVQALARDLGLEDIVRFAGFLDRDGKTREFSAHDIYLNTNRVDNMPVSILESAAYGVPVVATEVGGIPYLLQDGETALLTPDSDAPAMADAIRRLLDEDGLARRLSVNGRRLAESCAWPVVKLQWAALFSELLASGVLSGEAIHA
ncbi:MAG: glycosyltransferase family 4 protein [Chloroflexota bacterium]